MSNEMINANPSFVVWLTNITKYQTAIRTSQLSDKVKFRINLAQEIEAYTIRSGVIGVVAKKDAVLFPIIYEKPIFFEGKIIAIAKSSKSSLKVKVIIQVKSEYSFRLFKEYPDILEKYVSIQTLAKKDEIIICNYGRAKVLELYDDHILVEVPHLGKRAIYDITSIERYHE